jgi:hypothetical protein
MTDTISKHFNVGPIRDEFVPALRDDEEATIVSDAADARTSLKNILDLGGVALQSALALAQGSEDPKAYDSLANLMSTMADLNSKILAVHAAEQKLVTAAGVTTAVQNNTTTNNIVFSGTTEELSKLLSNKGQ